MANFQPITFAGLTSVGFQKMTLSNSTAIAINTTCRGGNILLVSVETQDARMRMDATAPTLTTGILISSGTLNWIDGYSGTSLLRFQRSTGTCVVQIMACKNVNAK